MENSYTTISQMFEQVTKDNSSKKLYFYKKLDEWLGISGSEIRSTVKDIAFGLQSIGGTKGANIALLSNNSPRWAMSDYGIICSGAATVSVYPTLIPSQIEYIINDSNSIIVFVENKEQLDKINQIWSNCPQLTHVVVMDDSASADNDKIINFMNFLDIGTKYEQESNQTFEDIFMPQLKFIDKGRGGGLKYKFSESFDFSISQFVDNNNFNNSNRNLTQYNLIHDKSKLKINFRLGKLIIFCYISIEY